MGGTVGFLRWLSLREAWAPHSPVTAALGRYLAKPQHSVLDVWHHFLAWDRSAEIADELGVDLHGDMYETAEKVDAHMNQHPELWEALHNYVMARDPQDAPSHMFMGPSGKVGRQTWLTHLSDDARSISEQGFRSGVADFSKLGLTYDISPTERGYTGEESQAVNFAFLSNSRDVALAARKGKYGRDAVMFMAPAQVVDHYGDEEKQAIFHGHSVKPGSMVLITQGDKSWTVRSKDPSRRDPYTGPDINSAEKWVMENWRQYAKIIMRGS